MTALRVTVDVGETKKGTTLGVAHFAANLINALDARPDVEVSVMGASGAAEGYGISSIISREDLESERGRRRAQDQTDAVVQIHHFLSREFDVATVTIVHDMHLFNVAWKYPSGREQLIETLEGNVTGADAVVSHFPGTIDALAERFPATRDRLHLVFAPTLLADFAVTEEARAWVLGSFALDDSIPTLLYPAQLQAHKNHWNLVAAVARLRDRGRPVRVICTGSSFRDYLTESLAARVTQRGLDELVHFTGYVEGAQLRALYDAVDGVISPSLAEGGAYIAQEAIVHDRPVACSDLPSVRAHLARLEVDVVRFDPMDVGAIGAAIEQLVDDGPAIVSGYERARAIEQSWTWPSLADDVARLARSAVASR